MFDVRELMLKAWEMEASDIHLIAGQHPTFRLYGHLVPADDYPVLSADDTWAAVKQIAPQRTLIELEEIMTADFAYALEDKCRLRVAVCHQKETVAMYLRILPTRLFTFEELGLNRRAIEPLLHAPKGLFLVTGPTGCGKTTTLATMVDYINEMRDCHVVTVEDPIEYYQYPRKSIFTQRELRVDVPSFAEGTIRAMRMDPDVMLVGEMRDLPTIRAAITAAETGHLVFSTLHTTGAARTVERVVGVFPLEEQEQIRIQLAGTLIAVISQILLPRKDRPGRVAAFEVMMCTNAISHLVRDRKEHAILSAIQTGQAWGMQTLDAHLLSLYERGMIEASDVTRNAQDRVEVVQRLQAMGAVLTAQQLHEVEALGGAAVPGRAQ